MAVSVKISKDKMTRSGHCSAPSRKLGILSLCVDLPGFPSDLPVAGYGVWTAKYKQELLKK
ncbi:MAG: hypothetical protein WCL29_03825 [Pseudomonadota bacterium]